MADVAQIDARERRQERLALALSRDALDEFHFIQTLSPQLSGEPLYERILSGCFGVDGAVAHRLVETARQNLAETPMPRDLKFCDVVHHFIVDQCLKGRTPYDAGWIRGRIGDIVRSVIPVHL
jgi:hypothetical protein